MNEEILTEMKQQVDIYKKDGKIEAANRYQDQINLLQVMKYCFCYLQTYEINFINLNINYRNVSLSVKQSLKSLLHHKMYLKIV